MSDPYREYEDQWLGNKRIKSATDAGETPHGIRLVRLVFDDGSAEEYTLKMLQAEGVVTKRPQDLTEFRLRRGAGPVRECLKILRDYGLKEKELDYVVNLLEVSVKENIREADRMLWGIEEDGGETLIAVDKVLLSKKKTLGDVLGKS